MMETVRDTIRRECDLVMRAMKQEEETEAVQLAGIDALVSLVARALHDLHRIADALTVDGK